MKIETRRDLRDWLNNYRYDVLTETGDEGLERALDAIWRDREAPPWGSSAWDEYLASERVQAMITEAAGTAVP